MAVGRTGQLGLPAALPVAIVGNSESAAATVLGLRYPEDNAEVETRRAVSARHRLAHVRKLCVGLEGELRFR